MWADDRFWLREMLVEKRHFLGRFQFEDDTMLSHHVEWLPQHASKLAKSIATRIRRRRAGSVDDTTDAMRAVACIRFVRPWFAGMVCTWLLCRPVESQSGVSY